MSNIMQLVWFLCWRRLAVCLPVIWAQGPRRVTANVARRISPAPSMMMSDSSTLKSSPLCFSITHFHSACLLLPQKVSVFPWVVLSTVLFSASSPSLYLLICLSMNDISVSLTTCTSPRLPACLLTDHLCVRFCVLACTIHLRLYSVHRFCNSFT